METQTFESAKKELQGKRGLALDIDDTLSVTRLFLFEEKQRRFGNPEDISGEEMIRKYKYTYNVPYWQRPEVKQWIEEVLNSETHWENLPLIEGASEAIKRIDATLPILLYLTARPDYTIKPTMAWLKKHGFPKRPIVAHPDFQYGNTSEWKGKALAALYPEVQGIIDDNPELILSLPENYKGTIYLYNNTEHPKTRIRVILCPTWNDVIKGVLQNSKI